MCYPWEKGKMHALFSENLWKAFIRTRVQRWKKWTLVRCINMRWIRLTH